LCRAVTSKDTVADRRTEATHEDSSPWEQARHAVASLMRELMQRRMAPLECRNEAWHVIQRLMLDPDPSRERELGKVDGFDPVGLAINSIRGNALQAAISYGHWIKSLTSDAAKEPWRGMASVPELGALLDKH